MDPILRIWRRSRGEPEDGPAEAEEEEGAAEGAQAEGAAAPAEPAVQEDASGDVEMQ